MMIVSVAWYLKIILYKNNTHIEHFIWTIDTKTHRHEIVKVWHIYIYYIYILFGNVATNYKALTFQYKLPMYMQYRVT